MHGCCSLSLDREPSHPYKAGVEHVGCSQTGGGGAYKARVEHVGRSQTGGGGVGEGSLSRRSTVPAPNTHFHHLGGVGEEEGLRRQALLVHVIRTAVSS